MRLLFLSICNFQSINQSIDHLNLIILLLGERACLFSRTIFFNQFDERFQSESIFCHCRVLRVGHEDESDQNSLNLLNKSITTNVTHVPSKLLKSHPTTFLSPAVAASSSTMPLALLLIVRSAICPPQTMYGTQCWNNVQNPVISFIERLWQYDNCMYSTPNKSDSPVWRRPGRTCEQTNEQIVCRPRSDKLSQQQKKARPTNAQNKPDMYILSSLGRIVVM